MGGDCGTFKALRSSDSLLRGRVPRSSLKSREMSQGRRRFARQLLGEVHASIAEFDGRPCFRLIDLPRFDDEVLARLVPVVVDTVPEDVFTDARTTATPFLEVRSAFLELVRRRIVVPGNAIE